MSDLDAALGATTLGPAMAALVARDRGRLETALAIVKRLLSAGAAVDIRDRTYNSDAAGWATACDDGSPAATTIGALLAKPEG